MSATAPATHSPEWHQLRSKGIGASEIATIAGIGRWGSRWAIWAEKTGQLEPDHTPPTPAQRTGLRMEKTLAEWFQEDTGLYIAAEQLMVNHPVDTWIRATLDGLVFEGCGYCAEFEAGGRVAMHEHSERAIEDALGPVNFKDTSDAPWTTERCDTVIVPPEFHDIPPYYEAQTLWEMAACGDWCERGWLYAKHSFGRVHAYEIARDQEAIDALKAAGWQFWHDHVLPNVPPALDGFGADATAAALNRVYGQGGAGEVDVTGLVGLVERLRDVKAKRRALEEEETELANEIKAEMGDADVGLIDGQPLVEWRKTKPRRTFDRAEFMATWPILAEEFMVEGEGERRLTLRWPCSGCGRALRAQDEPKHKCKTDERKT